MEIPLTHGKVALIDDADYPLVSGKPWFASKGDSATDLWYARYSAPRGARKHQKGILMHRVILGVSDSERVDHVNGVGTDNRRTNLRVCTNAQNQMNRSPLTRPDCPFKGVGWHKPIRGKRRGGWRARITIGGKQTHLGYFEAPEEAARAYDAAALRLFGEFARLNFPHA